MQMRVDTRSMQLSRAQSAVGALQSALQDPSGLSKQRAAELTEQINQALSQAGGAMTGSVPPEIASQLAGMLTDGQFNLTQNLAAQGQALDALREFLDGEFKELQELRECCPNCGKKGGT